MLRTVKCALIQCSNAAATDLPIEEIKRLNIEKHLHYIEDAAKQGVQILCMQEIFTTPYFCAEQQSRWYFFFQAEDGIRAADVTGVQTCALPIYRPGPGGSHPRPRPAPVCCRPAARRPAPARGHRYQYRSQCCRCECPPTAVRPLPRCRPGPALRPPYPW